jgi:uncharacterized protein with ATP-grasp and redox domains
MSFPPFLSTSEPGSYARTTILERKPQIIDQVINENHYPQPIMDALLSFKIEIAQYPVQPLLENAVDIEFWNYELEKYSECTWLELPWYFAETYFYRKLLEAVTYFQPGNLSQINPFQKQKERQIISDVQRMVVELERMEKLPYHEHLEALLHSALWGNRMDLSNFTVDETVKAGKSAREERRNIIIDHTDGVVDFLKVKRKEIHFINDNVGADIFYDLVLAFFLISSMKTDKIVFHLKNQPFFVSDAMPEDIYATIKVLNSLQEPYSQFLGDNLAKMIQAGQLILKTDPFWTSYLMFTQMPEYLVSSFDQADLVILKGDVNYRRLLEDRHWSHDTPIELITGYFPSSFLVLRTLKGEIIVGLKPGVAEEIQAIDPTWLINGQRGIIQLVLKQ